MSPAAAADAGLARDASWLRELGQRFSNWGRFGANDERGTLNYITRERVRAACALPRRGQVISCALPFDARGPQNGALGRFNPEHAMLSTGEQELPGGFRYADDLVRMPLQCGTQWDSLAHVFYDGKLYNGRDASLVTQQGARANSIDRIAAGVVGRGVLLDLPRTSGLRWLDDATALLPEDLDLCAERQGVTIESGDIVLLRTGRLGRALEAGSWDGYLESPSPGLSIRCARWLFEREIAAVASDTACVEVLPSEVTGCLLPLHMVAIRDIGLTLGEIFALDALAEACAADGNYDFLFAAPPLPITGAVGSPINPPASR